MGRTVAILPVYPNLKLVIRELNLDYWHKETGKPVLLADVAKINWLTKPGEFTRNSGNWYADVLTKLY
jgi:hypothetical protein